ncbi:MAG: DUF3102 domain-containing protein [Christensenellales bacterium]|jgi:hypothetical protein
MDVMTENALLSGRAETDISSLAALAAQARAYSENLAINMFQLGRVYTEAKKLVRHGEWAQWLRDNSGMSERSAQQLMQVYTRFGSQPAFMGLEKSKLFKLLSLPAGQETDFAEEHDLAAMTSREVEAAVKQAKAEMAAQLEEERRWRQQAEVRARELSEELQNKDGDELPDEVADTLRRQQATIQQQQDMLAAAQETINESSRRLVDQERRSARETALDDEPLGEALRGAVSAFLGSPAGTAAEDARRVMALDPVERQDVSRLVDMMAGWCDKMRKRLNELAVEGEIT